MPDTEVEDLLRRLAPQVLGAVVRRYGHFEEAEDATQEALIALSRYIKSLRAPLPQIELCPTGGVTIATVGEFIAAGACAVGAGADLVDIARLRRGDHAGLTESARKYVAAVQQARKE